LIAKGNTHSDGVKLADYLTKGGPGERAELLDMRGLGVHGDAIAGFREQAELAGQTKADKPFFHVQMRGAAGELQKLSRAQILDIVNDCDRVLGRAMTQQPRIASLHIDKATGDFHIHVGYSLVARAEDGRFFVQRLGKYENKLLHYARELELKYDLRILSNERNPGAQRADRNELEESRRLGTDVHAIRTAILDGFQKSDNGKSFAAAMKAHGWEVAAGDRRDCIVVIDQAGGTHALNKKLIGLRLNEINARLADLDRSTLPSVEHAQQMQRDRAAQEAQEREKHGRAADGQGRDDRPASDPQRSAQPEIKPLGQTAGEIRLAWQTTKTGAHFAQAIEDRGLILVHVSREEAADSYRSREYAKAINRQNRALKEGFAVVDRRGNVTRIDQRATGDHWEEIQKKLGGIDRRELLSVDQAREAMKEARKAEWAEKKRIEWEKARPATKLEQAIMAADKTAGRDDALFAAELGQEGIALARATAADLKALDALRRDQDLALATGEDPRRLSILANVMEGELCVVTKLGDVIPLNQQHMAALDNRSFAGAPAHSRSTELVAGDPKSSVVLPSVTDARYTFALSADLLAEFWRSISEGHAADRQDAFERRIMRFETGQAIDRQEAIAGSLQEAKQGVIGVAEQTVDTGMRAASGLLGSFDAALGKALDWAADFIAPPPPPTPAQIRQRQIAESERREHEARVVIPAAEQAQRMREIVDEARDRQHERERQRER
jgi:hypothetical protein